MSKANPTDAKTCALHFLKAINVERLPPSLIAKTVNQAKNLLSNGYTKEEICDTINYIVENKDVAMYSFGYINTVIPDILKEIEHKRLLEVAEKEKELLKLRENEREGVRGVDESSERNKNKAKRFGLQKPDWYNYFE